MIDSHKQYNWIGWNIGWYGQLLGEFSVEQYWSAVGILVSIGKDFWAQFNVWFNSVIGLGLGFRERERESFVGNDCSMRFLFKVMLRIKWRHFVYIYIEVQSVWILLEYKIHDQRSNIGKGRSSLTTSLVSVGNLRQ